MRSSRGILLMAVLCLISILLLLCWGELGRQAEQYRAARLVSQSAQARGLALAGLQDFLAKWNRDYDFPPRPPQGAAYFTYLEELDDFQSPEKIGSYRVTVDESYKLAPYKILRVTSEGVVGPSDRPQCLWRIVATLDVSPKSRTGIGPNPHLGNWIEWREGF
ncbi:MAG: hypothetical protein U0931_17585 [Vulcanimicrobiota bacterium]